MAVKSIDKSFLISSAFTVGVLLLFGKSLNFSILGHSLILESNIMALLLISLSLFFIFRLNFSLSCNAFLAALALVFISDWMSRPYNLLQGPIIRGEIIIFSIFTFYILSKKLERLFNLLPILTILTCAAVFLQVSAGRLIFSDDHGVFLFRLHLLKQNFPFIPFYYPLWNAGMDARDFFATGSLNVFTIFSPFIYLFPVEKIYNYILILLILAFHPFCIYLAAKFEKIPSPGPAIAAALALSATLVWHRWALQYGTLGFITSLSLIPLNLAIVNKIIDDKEPLSRSLTFFFVLSLSLMLFWSLSGLVFIPAILIFFLRFKKLIFKKNIILTAILVLLINLPWIVTFWTVSNVSSFIKYGSHSAKEVLEQEDSRSIVPIKVDSYKQHIKESLRILRENLNSTNPLIFTIGLFGLLAIKAKSQKLILYTVIWLLILATLVSPLNPRLEFDRMLVVLAIIMILPTCRALLQFFQSFPSDAQFRIRKILVSLCGGFLIASQFSAAGIIGNRSLVQFHFTSNEVRSLAEAITEHAGEGRALFSGFVLHELNEGHLAPLGIYTKTPLIASSHVHNLWKYRDVIPRSFLLKGEEGIEEFFNLQNATLIIAHEKYWRDFFRSRPLGYLEVWQRGKFAAFRRLDYQSTYFQEGSGEILAQTDSAIFLSVDIPNVVIKFNYFHFLRSDSCNISFRDYEGDLRFIALSDCPLNTPIKIDSLPVHKRLLDAP